MSTFLKSTALPFPSISCVAGAHVTNQKYRGTSIQCRKCVRWYIQWTFGGTNGTNEMARRSVRHRRSSEPHQLRKRLYSEGELWAVATPVFPSFVISPFIASRHFVAIASFFLSFRSIYPAHSLCIAFKSSSTRRFWTLLHFLTSPPNLFLTRWPLRLLQLFCRIFICIYIQRILTPIADHDWERCSRRSLSHSWQCRSSPSGRHRQHPPWRVPLQRLQSPWLWCQSRSKFFPSTLVPISIS